METTTKNIFNDIIELSDLEKQKTYWLGKDPNHVSSYVELMCRLFDDDNFDDFVDNTASQIGFSKKAILELIKLRELLNNYKEKETDREIIEDSEWKKIAIQAKVVIENWDNV